MPATGTPILIAAWSGRMLAAAARRAGYHPLVVDCFGDDDTRALAADIEVLPSAYAAGFAAKPLLAALDRLAARSPRSPPGLVLGSGFEDRPKLLSALERRFKLIGCTPDTVHRSKHPDSFFPLLRRLGIPHPETRVDAPTNGRGWLSRRIGGSGGGHIAICRDTARNTPSRYFQRRITGTPVSLSGVVSRTSLALGFTTQWSAPRPRRPYRFGGAVGPVTLDADLEARMIDMALALVPELGLVGLVSFDFLVSEGEALLLEVNPRPGATLDILDSRDGAQFSGHVAACLGEASLAGTLGGTAPPSGARAVAYLYADMGNLTVPRVDWPEWTADRPAAGTVISQHAPLATILAHGPDPETACQIARQRSTELAEMLYREPSGKERQS